MNDRITELADSIQTITRPHHRDRSAVAGAIIIGLFVLVSIFGKLLAPQSDLFWPTGTKWADDPHGYVPHPPDTTNWLGTLAVREGHRQMDVFSTVVQGSRSALLFGLGAALFTCLLGTLIGALSAAAGGWVNEIIMRFTDAFLTLPVVVGVVIIQQLLLMVSGVTNYGFGSYSRPSGNINEALAWINPVWLALILFSWMPYARLTSSMVLRVKQEAFVTAARALGAGYWTTLRKHLLPNSLAPVVILLARDIGGFVLLQSTFTFIGLGGESEWGASLAYARDWIIGPGGSLVTRWWTYLPVTLALVLFGMGWNLIGDGINLRLNPQARND
jgi:peptide/nickel transport system permease protein